MVLEAVLDIFTLPQDLKTGEGAEDLDNLDPEDTTFQASFSKLGASESTVRDPVANVADAKLFLSKQLAAASARNPGKVGQLTEGIMEYADSLMLVSFLDASAATGEPCAVCCLHAEQ
jgi:exportin-2 (importin alpha re-exporter)